MTAQPSVAIIGAGLAGLTCGTALKGLIERVTIFEQNDFPGGRVSRIQLDDHEFNHGVQYFTARHPLFLKIVAGWQTDGIVRPWDSWIVELTKGQIVNSEMDKQRFVGVPRMHAVAKHLARQCQLVTATSITELDRQEGGGWRLFNAQGDYQGAFDIVIVATAAPQVANLCRLIPEIAKRADSVQMTSCWSGMLVFNRKLELPYDAAYVRQSPLSWVSRYQAQEFDQDADQESDCWVLHATPEWSQQHVVSFRARVQEAMLEAFWEATDLPQTEPKSSMVHCWKQAAPINPLNEDSLFVESDAIGACGDWCTTGRVEGAVLSGFSIADRIMKHINMQSN